MSTNTNEITPTTTTAIIQQPQLSELIERLGDYMQQAKKTQSEARVLVEKIAQQARVEQVSDSELRAMLTDTLSRRGLQSRMIYNYLPASIKDQTKRNNRLGKKSKQPHQIDQMTHAAAHTATLPPRLFASLYNYMQAKKALKLLIEYGEVRRIERPEI